MVAGNIRIVRLLAFVAIAVFSLATPGTVFAHPSLPDSQYNLGSKSPLITNVTYTPLYPTPNDVLNISATVVDPENYLNRVTMAFCNRTLCFLEREMNPMGNNRFAVDLDLVKFYPGDWLDIEIFATDKNGTFSNTTKGDYNVTIMRVPNALTVMMSLNRYMCPPEDTLLVTGNATFDSGAPAPDANVTISFKGESGSWKTITNKIGWFNTNITSPKDDGNYTVTADAQSGNLSGTSKRQITVTSKYKLAPDYNTPFTDIDGKKFKLSDYGQNVILLDFMSITCTGCAEVQEALLNIYHNYKNKSVVFITMDISTTDTDAQLQAHRTKNNIPWRVTRVPPSIVQNYSFTEIPTVAIINKDGYLTFINTGILKEDDYSAKINEALTGGTIITLGSDFWFIVIAAVALGVMAFFSPCSFPLLPGYIVYYLGMNKGDDSPIDTSANDKDGKVDLTVKKKKKGRIGFAMKGGIASGLGLVVVFLIVGLLMILPLGQVLLTNTKYVNLIFGLILIFFGALMFTNIQYYFIINPIKSGIDKVKGKLRSKKSESNDVMADQTDKKAGVGSLFAYGIGYGAASLGCTLPMFLTIIVLGIGSGNYLNAFFILLAFSVSAAILMVVITVIVAIFELVLVNKIKAATPIIKKISGVLLIVVGVYLLYLFWTVSRTL